MSNGAKHKMYDYEVTPPAGVWERIAEELDESELAEEYPSRLRGLEVMPPAAFWNKIATSLDADLEKPIPASRKISPVLRYAAAAAIIAFLSWGGYRLITGNSSGKKSGDEIVKEDRVTPTDKPVDPSNQPTDVTPDKIVSRDPVIDDEARNDSALEASKKTYAKLSTPIRSKIKNAAGFHFAIENIEPLPPVDIDPATRYIVLMTPEGNIIRMSKKLKDLVCCVSGEEQDADCVDQMKKWREKVAGSSFAYSPGNFGDILNLVKALQE